MTRQAPPTDLDFDARLDALNARFDAIMGGQERTRHSAGAELHTELRKLKKDMDANNGSEAQRSRFRELTDRVLLEIFGVKP